MSKTIKYVEFLDLTRKPIIAIKSIPPSQSETKKIIEGSKVCVQTQRASEFNFYIVLEVTGHNEGPYVGKVVGQEGYEGPMEIIYPGKYLKFDFDGLSTDDQVYFDENNVAIIF